MDPYLDIRGCHMSGSMAPINGDDPFACVEGLLTLAEVKSRFRANGVTIAEWATTHGFNPTHVYAVMKGKRKCLRGESFRIAVALCMKAKPTPAWPVSQVIARDEVRASTEFAPRVPPSSP